MLAVCLAPVNHLERQGSRGQGSKGDGVQMAKRTKMKRDGWNELKRNLWLLI